MWVRGCFAILCDICLLFWKKSDPSLVFGLSMRYKGNSIWNILVSYSEKRLQQLRFETRFPCYILPPLSTVHHTTFTPHTISTTSWWSLSSSNKYNSHTHTGNKRKCTPSSLYASRAVGCKARWKITDVLLGSWRSFSKPHTYVLTSRLRICN